MPFLFVKNENQIAQVKTTQVSPGKNQPRLHFSEKSIRQLADSIKEHGILQPLIVTGNQKDGFTLIAGERRLRAAILAGLDTVPVMITDKSEKECAAISLIENIQREDLTFFEQAKGYRRLMDEYAMTQSEIATAVSKKQSTISNKLRLLKLPPAAQAIIVANGLTERHARELLRIQNNAVLYQTLDKIVQKNLNVSQTESYIDDILTPKNDKKPFRHFKISEMKIYLNTINKAVNLIKKSGIKPQTSLKESDEFVEYIIKIPKTS